MNLILDIGNTNSKYSVFESGRIKSFGVWDSSEVKEEFQNWNNKNQNCESIIVSDVIGTNKSYFESVTRCPLVWVSAKIKLPYKINYKIPEELGADRIGLVAAAVFAYPKKNCLVIDIGTCITYDFVSKNSVYLGGSISPGFSMRYNSISTNTSSLPELKITIPKKIMADSTETCIHSGIYYGIYAEIENQINFYKKIYKDLTIILTGGHSKYFVNRIKNVIFANHNFISKGLFNILKLNNS